MMLGKGRIEGVVSVLIVGWGIVDPVVGGIARVDGTRGEVGKVYTVDHKFLYLACTRISTERMEYHI